MPLWGMLLAAALIVSRRPEAVTHAQFWAEDGKMYFADVYNHGLIPTLVVPQAGYFQELPVLAAWLAQLVPLAFAPLVTNAVAILVRVLPVGLLLSNRAETISRDIRVRGLLAALYIALPGAPEADGNAVNALWFLAVAALIVLMLRPAVRRSGRVLDIAIITLCATTGVFSIALAPLAFLYRRWRGRDAVSGVKLAILSAGAAIQLLAIFVLEYHLPRGFGATTRPSFALHATAGRFFEIFGLRVLAEPIFGNSVALGAACSILLGALGVTGALLAFRRASAELKLTIAAGGALFVMALARPYNNWPELAHPDLANLLAGARYFIIPQLALAATLVWAIGRQRAGLWRVLLTVVLAYACLVTIPREWAYPPIGETEFAQQASQFEHSKPGTHMVFALEPNSWSMTLTKH